MPSVPPPSPASAAGAASLLRGASTGSSSSISFHDSVHRAAGGDGKGARATRLRATTSTHFKTMLSPQNREMHRQIDRQRAAAKIQATELAKMQRELETKALVVEATITRADITEYGPLSSVGAQGEVFKAIWKRMIPVAIKENKSGDWAVRPAAVGR